MYDLDAHVAEIYDQMETKTADVALLRRLIGAGDRLYILEPFCGTGRVLIPLALDGHTVMGLDRSPGMLARAQVKLGAMPPEARERIRLSQSDVLKESWPAEFDLVILGGNCLYELATAEEQAQVIASAAGALRPGGRLFVDNDHMEGELDRSWIDPPLREGVFPTGACADGTCLESRWRVTWYDAPRRLIRFLRQTRVSLPDGTNVERDFVQEKHPVSTAEVAGWLTGQGFTIGRMLGDHEGHRYSDAAPRAIFWARTEA
jgi:SAM-dependent methyltransferase